MTDEVQTPPTESSGFTQFAYTVSEFDILLEPTLKTEIIEQREVYPVPHAPDWCRGMISLRGRLIPVINLHHLLGKHFNQDHRWLLVIDTQQLPPAAIPIDRLPMQQHIQPETLSASPADHLPFWVKQTLDVDGQTVYEADHGELFQHLTHQSTLHTAHPTSDANSNTHLTDSSGNKA